MKAKSISTKLLLIILGLAVLFSIFIGWYLYYFRSKLIEEANQSLAARLQTLVDTQIEGKLQILATNAITIAHNSHIIESLQKEDRELAMREAKRIIDEFIGIGYRGTGIHLIRSNLTSFWRSFDERRDDDVSFRPLLRQVQETGKVVSGVEIGRVGVGLRAIAPVKDETDRLVGMVETLFGVGSISRALRRENGFYILLVSKDAVDEALYREKTGAQTIGDRFLTAHGNWFDQETLDFARGADFEALKRDRMQLGKDYFYAATEAKDYSGQVFGIHLVGMTRKHYDEQIGQVFALANQLLIAVAVIGALGAVVILVMLRRVVIAPVSMLSEFLLHLGNDLTKRFHWHSDDEIGRVGQTVNAFLGNLAQVLQGTLQRSAQVSAAAVQLHTAASTIHRGIGVMFDQAASVAASSEEMAMTSAEIARSCQYAVDEARAATQAAQDGSAVVSSAIQSMERIAERVRQAAETVRALGVRSDQIGVIAASIKEIADQTNLLALNAAIEAARAGEQGRGFAVVADEVRKLAERTTRATGEIDAMIRAIQGETRAAVEQMEQGVADVEQGTLAASNSGAALREIVNKIHAATSQIDQIAVAAERQTATTAEIAESVVKIKGVANEGLQSAEQLDQAARQLADLARQLQQEISQFRV